MRNSILLTALLATSSVASANLLVNGDFSLPVPSNGTGNGWTSATIDHVGGWFDSGGNPGGTFFLNHGGSSESNPTLTQVVALQVGHRYRISGDFGRSILWQPANLDFGVQIDGNLWEYHVPSRGWRTFTEYFVATSPTATLILTGERLRDSDPKVDNIVLIPEPATFVALAAGLALLARRRR